jgi:hypothetical protein
MEASERIDTIIVSSYLKGEKWQITLLFNPGNMISDFFLSFGVLRQPRTALLVHTGKSLAINSFDNNNFPHTEVDVRESGGDFESDW